MDDVYKKINFIGAGAGSGKTYKLTQIIQDCTNQGISPSEMMVTTFTRKAATELRERARSHLMLTGKYLDGIAMMQASIGTIDSLCSEILKRYALEAGLSPEIRVIEERHANQLFDRALEEALACAVSDAFMDAVHRLGMDKIPWGSGDGDDKTTQIPWRKAVVALQSCARTNRIAPEQLADMAKASIECLLAELGKEEPSTECDVKTLLDATIADIGPGIEAGGGNTDKKYLEMLRELKATFATGDYAWAQWVKPVSTKSQTDTKPRIATLVNAMNRLGQVPAFRCDIKIVTKGIFRLAEAVMHAYQRIKDDEGVIDFVDLETKVLALLEIPDIASDMRARVRVLMVDEFQDTNPLQLAIFMRLGSLAEKVWWVGDQKQAIYGFRGSDQALTRAVFNRVAQRGIVSESLSQSWRSRPALVSLVNQLFVPAFAHVSADHVKLSPARTDTLEGTALMHWHINRSNKEKRVDALADMVFALLNPGEGRPWQHPRGVYDKALDTFRPMVARDVAILAFQNSYAKSIAAALRKRGVPVLIEQPGLMSTPEVTLLMACLRRLHDRRDTIATAIITSLADSLEPEAWLADRLSWLAQPEQSDNTWGEVPTETHQAQPQVKWLADNLPQLLLHSPSSIIERVISGCGLIDIVGRWSATAEVVRQRLANIDEMHRLAREYEESCVGRGEPSSFAGLLSWYETLERTSSDMFPDPGTDAVHVMTHHKAKGLEWPVVILCELNKEWKASAFGAVVSRPENMDPAQPLEGVSLTYWPSGLDALKKLGDIARLAGGDRYQSEALREREEAKRLLYVSMTRARDLLVIVNVNDGPVSDDQWLGVIDHRLLTTQTSQTLTLDDNTKIEFEYHPNFENMPNNPFLIQPVDHADSQTVYIFTHESAETPFMARRMSPSAQTGGSASIVSRVALGHDIKVRGSVEPALLGEAFHAVIAHGFSDANTWIDETSVANILDASGMSGVLSALDASRQLTAFRDWLTADRGWLPENIHVEIPVDARLDDGRVLSGRIDMLIDAGDHWVLIDHKTKRGDSTIEQIADEYVGQLTAYEHAISHVTGKRVKESWLYLPLSGEVVRVNAN